MITTRYTLILLSMAGIMSFTGCATSNAFGVGYEKSACEASSKGGFCGSPSAIYKNKKLVKKIQEDYKSSGFPDDLFFSITPSGKILVKAERDDRWQPYEDSRYQEEIDSLIAQKYGKTNIKNANSKNNYGFGDDLSIEYRKKIAILNTNTNVGKMIRDNGRYTRTWVAPAIDKKGDLVSAHELYIVLDQPKWILGEKTPERVTKASTPTPFSSNILGSETPKENSMVRVINAREFKSNTKDLDILKNYISE